MNRGLICMHGRFRCGKATKRSRYGSLSKDRVRRTIWSAELCTRAGLSYHLIDSEWKMFYMMPYEAQELIACSKGLKTIIAFSTRHRNSLRLLDQTMSGLDTRNVALNLIVGNPAYLSSGEIRRPYFRTLVDTVKFVRSRFEDLTMFVGIEGLGAAAVELCVEYDLLPFLLLDKGLEDMVAMVKDITGRENAAVYAPFLVSKNYPRLLRDILYRLSGYVMRRRWVREGLKKLGYDPTVATLRAVIQEKRPLPSSFMESNLGIFLEEAASYLTMYGDVDSVTGKISDLRRLGIMTLIGFPIKENAEQILLLGKCASKIA